MLSTRGNRANQFCSSKKVFWQITPPEYLFLVSALPIRMLKKIFRQASPPEYLFSGLRSSHFGLQKDFPASQFAVYLLLVFTLVILLFNKNIAAGPVRLVGSLGVLNPVRVLKPVQLVGLVRRPSKSTRATRARQRYYEGSPLAPAQLLMLASKISPASAFQISQHPVGNMVVLLRVRLLSDLLRQMT